MHKNNRSPMLTVLILNGSLKHAPELSNTEELCQQVLAQMERETKITSTIIRLADYNLPPGVGFEYGKEDDWPRLAKTLIATDIVIFATPIWWGHRSSLMQRVIERMDSFDEGALGGREALQNKVAGIVITGSEDGAQAVCASLMEVLTFMNFTLPPQCCAYWVGEVGGDPKEDRDKRLKSKAAGTMAQKLAKNLIYYGQLLKEHPMK
jgi:multimeric flavodoxin WrbA